MAWVKIPREHHPIFVAALPPDDRIEVVAMFGGLAATLNGHMLGGLFGTSAMVKLGEAHRAELAALGGERFDPMGNGRVMSEALVLPQRLFDDRRALARWLERARDHVATLPPKKKTKTSKTSKTSKAKVKQETKSGKAPAKAARAAKAELARGRRSSAGAKGRGSAPSRSRTTRG